MKKSDLKMGMVVKTRRRNFALIFQDNLIINGNSIPLKDYDENFNHQSMKAWDITEIYQVTSDDFNLRMLERPNYKCLNLLWQRPMVELSPAMRVLLKLIPKNYCYLTKNSTGTQGIVLHEGRPNITDKGNWSSLGKCCFYDAYAEYFTDIPMGTCIQIDDYIERG